MGNSLDQAMGWVARRDRVARFHAQRQPPPTAPSTDGPPTFRAFLESRDYCDLELSPLVAAIVDASEGRTPDTIDEETCRRYFGCGLGDLPRTRRRSVAVQAGGRGGKTSRLLAPKALHAAWTAPLPTLQPGEHAVSLIVSSELAFARQALSFCRGYVERSPALRGALVGKPGTDALTLRRPDGHLVDVRVRAAGARGKGGRAFTLVFAGLDEACFFYDDSGVVNDREIYRACAQRVVPDGQLWLVSTPWVAGVGLLEEQLAANWGDQTRGLAVRGVGTRALNPTWDPTGEIERDLRETDPDNAAREIDAQPLTSGTLNFFSREAIEAALVADRAVQLPRDGGRTYAAGGDTGFKRNSSALAVVEVVPPTGTAPARYRLARLEERKPLPGAPLKPAVVVAEFAAIMAEYGVREFVVDAHEGDEVGAALLAANASAVSAPDKHAAYVVARSLLHEGRVELPANPRLRQQLRDVMARPMPGGGTQITSPKRADGSHGDLVSALVNALWRAAVPPVVRTMAEEHFYR